MGNFVTVGCKLPHGLVMEMPGKSEMLQPPPIGKRVQIAGANSVRTSEKLQAIFPAAFTQVEEEFATEWFKRNAELPMVKNGLVFMEAKKADAEAIGKDVLKENTGLEGLRHDKDPRAGGLKGEKAKAA